MNDKYDKSRKAKNRIMESISEMTSNMDLSKKSSKEMRLVLKEHNKIRAIEVPEVPNCITDHSLSTSLSAIMTIPTQMAILPLPFLFGVAPNIALILSGSFFVTGSALFLQSQLSEGKNLDWLTRLGMFFTSKSKSHKSFKNRILAELNSYKKRESQIRRKSQRLDKARFKLEPIIARMNDENTKYTFAFGNRGLEYSEKKQDENIDSAIRAFSEIEERRRTESHDDVRAMQERIVTLEEKLEQRLQPR